MYHYFQIDEDAVRGMSTSDLEEFLPRKGDRFALKDFFAKSEVKPKTKKESLMDQLKDRLRSSKRVRNTDTRSDEDEPHSSSTRKTPKLSAKKPMHKVHLGWYHFDENQKIYLQPAWELNEMDVELTDFQLKPLDDEETTLGDIIDRAKLQYVHFYIRTRQKQSDEEGNHQERKKEEKCIENKSANQQLDDTEDAVSNADDKAGQSVIEHSADSSEYDKPREFMIGDNHDVDVLKPDLKEYISEDDNDSPLPDPLLFPVWEDSLGEVSFMRTEPALPSLREPKEFGIVVHRGQVMKELIDIFKQNVDVDFTRDNISATIILPNGEKELAFDNGGVMRDLLTEFWDDFYEKCTTGTNLRVPCLRHDMEAADWRAVGRIIALGWITQKIIPIRLSKNFLSSSLYGLASSNLRDEFLEYIPLSESKILSQALENMEEIDRDDLMEILSNHECKVIVTRDNLGAVIDQIAHMEMVQEPAFIRECLFEVLITYELEIDVENEVQKITPTPKKLLASLECDEVESDSFKYLKRYIREIDTDTKAMRTMLRYLTASDVMLYDSDGNFFKIKVKLVDLNGFSRRPVAHTCGRVLDLPRMYESYPVFKSEMNAVLNANIWVMDFA
ncbi:hypothetical protein FSP39_022027 [Pinctada imbricata]|uniref:HECT domain-containing protein n=1 Tax=Pinctada imbricata TaxID=66713 RepID=A0AA88YPF5_PINIB|nr:hypothetical protein FSP39_022027 [Pinctada imbricata]